jgi:hypothetical protein
MVETKTVPRERKLGQELCGMGTISNKAYLLRKSLSSDPFSVAISHDVAWVTRAEKFAKKAEEAKANGKTGKERRLRLSAGECYSEAALCPGLETEKSLEYHGLAAEQFKKGGHYWPAAEWTRKLQYLFLKMGNIDLSLKLADEKETYRDQSREINMTIALGRKPNE